MEQAFFNNLPLPLLLVCLNEHTVIKSNAAFDRLYAGTPKPGTKVDLIFSGLKASEVIKNQASQLAQAEKVQRQDLVMHSYNQTDPAFAVWLELFGLPGADQLDSQSSCSPSKPANLAKLGQDNNSGTHPKLAYVAVMTVNPDAPLLEDNHFNALFDSLPDQIFFKDTFGKYITCNKSFEDIIGENRSSLHGKTVPQFFQSSEVAKTFMQMDDQVLANKISLQQDCLTIYPGGEEVAEEVVKAPYFGPQGQTLGLVAVSRNIDQRQEELKRVQINERLLMSINQAVQTLLMGEPEKFDQNLYNALKQIGQAADVSRVYVWQAKPASQIDQPLPYEQLATASPNAPDAPAQFLVSQISEWCNHNISPVNDPALGENVTYLLAEYWHNLLLNNQCINGHTRTMPEALLFPTGEQNTCSILAAPIFLDDKFWGFIGFDECNQDRTWSKGEEGILRAAGSLIASAIQQLHTSRALQRSESTFCNIIYATNEIIWEVDMNLQIVFISGRLEEVLGPGVKSVQSGRIDELFKNSKDYQELFGQIIFPQIKETGFFSNIVHQLKNKQDVEFWFTASGAGVYDENQNLIGVRGVSLNITAEKKAKQELEQSVAALKQANAEIETYASRVKELAYEANAASRAKSEFLANIGHEVRTPINIINGMSYLAMESGLNSKQQDYVTKIKDAGQSLFNILTDIIDFANRDDGGFVLSCDSFDLAKMLKEIIKNLKPLVGTKDINIKLQISPDIPERLMGDKARLKQVLTNIISNAIKFTEAGHIIIRCLVSERDKNHLSLHCVISDTGIGMPEDAFKAVFDPFFQLEMGASRRFGGAGMGLALTRRLITAMGGDIWIESKLGEGTQVFFTLKLDCDPRLEVKRKACAGVAPDIATTKQNQPVQQLDLSAQSGFEELVPPEQQKYGELGKINERKLQLLEELLIADDAQALNMAQELAPCIQKIDADLAENIAQAISVFDYSTALEFMHELKKRI